MSSPPLHSSVLVLTASSSSEIRMVDLGARESSKAARRVVGSAWDVRRTRFCRWIVDWRVINNRFSIQLAREMVDVLFSSSISYSIRWHRSVVAVPRSRRPRHDPMAKRWPAHALSMFPSSSRSSHESLRGLSLGDLPPLGCSMTDTHDSERTQTHAQAHKMHSLSRDGG